MPVNESTVPSGPVETRGSTIGTGEAPPSQKSTHSVLISFTASSIALAVATTAAGAISLRWLHPAETGIWQTLLLAQAVLGVLRLGVLSGMNRELPYSIGAGDHERARRMASVAMAHSVACAILAFVGFGLFVPWSFTRQTDWRWPLVGMTLVASCNFYYGYIQSTLRSSADFQRLGRLQLMQGFVVSTQPVAAWLWGFAGFCGHAAVQAVLLLLLAHRIRPFHVAPRFDARLAASLLATGVPLFLGTYLQTLAVSLDRFVLLRNSGMEALGYYAPAMAVFGAMTVVPGSLTNFFYPKLSYEAGRGDSPLQLWHSVTFAVSRSVLLLLPMLLAGWFLIPPLVQALLPTYARSIPAMQIALLSGIALAAATCTTLLGVLKAWRSLYFYLAVLLVTKAIFTSLGSRHRDPVLGVAIGSAVSVLLSACLSVWLVYRATHVKTNLSQSTS